MIDKVVIRRISRRRPLDERLRSEEANEMEENYIIRHQAGNKLLV